MYMLHTNPPPPLWKEALDAPPSSITPQSRDGHVTSTTQLPVTPVRVERYLKPKQATHPVVVTAASPRMERKIAPSAVKSSTGQLAGTKSFAEASTALRLSQLENRASAFMPQKEASALPQLLSLSSHTQDGPLAGASGTQLYTNSKKVARLLSFNETSLRDEDGTPLEPAEDGCVGLYSVDSLDQSDTTSTLSTELNGSSVVSPRFYDGLPITLEELLSSSNESSTSASPQQHGKEGTATTHTQMSPSLTASALSLSFTKPSSRSQWQQDKLETHPHPLPPLAAIPLTPLGTDTVVRPSSSPVLAHRSEYISIEGVRDTAVINSLRTTHSATEVHGLVVGQTGPGTAHRPRLLVPGPSSPRVAIATNARIQPVAAPPPITALPHPHRYPSRDLDTKALRAMNFRKLHLLKKVIAIWRAGVAMKKDQGDLLHRKMLLRRGVKALWHNYRVAMETNKMAVWHLQQEKTRRYLYTWKSATKARQLAALHHFFLLWKRMHQLRAIEQRLTEAKNHALLSAQFLQWRDTFRFSLMEISASQFWRARVVEECFTEWRIRKAQQQYCAYAEEVVMVTRQTTLKRHAFQEWRLASDVRRQENAVAQMDLLQEAFGHWRSLTFDMRETIPGMVQSATDHRKHTLLKKGFRKWLLKYRCQCFERKRGTGLLTQVWHVWCQRVGQRGRDMISATSFSQQMLVRCCWVEMKRWCAAKRRREKVAAFLRQQALLQRCFLGWRRYMYRATLRCVCVQYVGQKRSRQLQACFDQWVLSFRQQHDEGALSMCASRASERTSLRRAFTAWVAVGRCAGAQRCVQERTRRLLMQRCFIHWRAVFRRHRTLQQLALSKARRTKESTFCLWRGRLCHNHAERTALQHHRLCSLKRSFAVWKGEYLKLHHSLTCGALYLKSLTSRCLRLWRERTAVRRRLGATLERVLQESEVERKREVLALWRRRTGRVRAVRLLSGLFTGNLLKKCLQAWHHHTACSISEIEVSFLTHLHQAILSKSHHSISTPTAVSSITHSHTALPSRQPSITSAADLPSPAPTVETVKRSLFQGTSLLSLPFTESVHTVDVALKSVNAPMEEISTEWPPSTPHCHISAATGVGTREVGVSHESAIVVALPSPSTKIRILEESPSPPTTDGDQRGIPLPLTPSQVSESTTGYMAGDVSHLAEAESLTPDSLDEEDVSFLSVNLCTCVSDELRAQLQELESALPMDSSCLDISDDDSLGGMEPRWTEQEWDPTTAANSTALPTSAAVSLVTDSYLAPSSLHGTVEGLTAGLPKDSAVVSRLIRILHCWRMYPCGKVLHQWRCYTAWKKRLRETYNTTSECCRVSILRDCLGAWRERVQKCATMGNRCETLSECFAERQLGVVFSHWRRSSQCLLERSTAMGKAAEAHYANTLQRQGLHSWCEEVSRRKQDRVNLQKLELWRTKAAFAAWRQCMAARSVMIERTTQAAEVISRKTVLARRFTQWKERLLALKRASEAANGLFQNRQNLTLLSQSYHLWQQRCAHCHEQMSSADILRARHLLRRSMSTWRRHHIATMRREKEMILAADRFTMKSAMKRWKMSLDAMIRASAVAGEHHSSLVLRVSFHYWKERAVSSLSCRRMNVKSAEDFCQRSTKSRYLRQWRKYLIVQEAERQERCRILLKKQKASKLQQSFKLWRHQFILARRMHQFKAARCQSVIIYCWGRWKGSTRVADTADKQYATTVLLRSWRKWRISFVEQRTADKVVAAANRRRAKQILKTWISVTFPARDPSTSPLHEEHNTASLHTAPPPLLGVSTQSLSRELMGHIFTLWKYRTKMSMEPRTLCS